MSKKSYNAKNVILTVNGVPVTPFNCRCTFITIQERPKQFDLFGDFVPATLSLQDIIEEMKK